MKEHGRADGRSLRIYDQLRRLQIEEEEIFTPPFAEGSASFITCKTISKGFCLLKRLGLQKLLQYFQSK